MSSDMLYQLAVALATAGAIYGGIRADLRAMHERIKNAEESARAAHVRLDNHLERVKP